MSSDNTLMDDFSTKEEIQKMQNSKIYIATTRMGDEKPLRVRPSHRSSFSDIINVQQAEVAHVENFEHTIASFGWANTISLANTFIGLAYIALATLFSGTLDPDGMI